MNTLTIISRDEAQATGRLRFYTGASCKRGHLCERYTSTGGCVQCVNRTTRGVSGRNVKHAALIFPSDVPEATMTAAVALAEYLARNYVLPLIVEYPSYQAHIQAGWSPQQMDEAKLLSRFVGEALETWRKSQSNS